jgi:hypothetical protein
VVLCIRKKGCIGAHYTYLFLFQKDLWEGGQGAEKAPVFPV